jgi:hypothetical protein
MNRSALLQSLPRTLTLATLFPAAFFVGLFTVLWIAAGYATHNALAFVMTLLIGAFFALGAWELRRFRQATNSLNSALAAIPAGLNKLSDWLTQLHPSLHNAVRLRVEGERATLPGPALAPYITGLLVLLGMLGTFLGMVVTLNGTVMALESTTDIQSIRASLAGPVKGLGVAFGTSVAGVAASAMLGLMSALARRERLQAAQALDTQVATTLRVFSLAHQREETLQTLQVQARLMPEVVSQLQALMQQMERQSLQLNERLLSGQDSFHRNAQAAYTGLAASVEQSLKTSLADSAQAASSTVQTVVAGAMREMTRDASALHSHIASAAQQQFEGLAARFDTTMRGVSDNWTSALARSNASFEQGTATLISTLTQHHGSWVEKLAQSHADMQGQLAATASGLASETTALHGRMALDAQAALNAAAAGFEQHATGLLRTVDQARLDLQTEIAARDEARMAAWTDSLQAMTQTLQREWQQAGVQAQEQTRHTLGEITQLLAAAADAPKAAAEVIAQLRQQLSESIAHDNGLLEERRRIMETLATLLNAVNHASTEQRSAIDALVNTSASMLQSVGSRFTEQVAAESDKLSSAAAHVTSSAVEVASLGEAFGVAVQLFSDSNAKLATQLQRVEGTLGQSITRSDEQLAYYVAQAREIIDLSLLSQKQIVEDLQRFAKRQAALAGEAA